MIKAKKVLRIEDNPNDIELSLRVLKMGGIRNEVVVARDGVERA